ncbi:hypothetical protein ACHAXH_005958 [Discostella pseudostelligera]
MGERKVLNKYIPADFDPQLVPKGKKPKDDLVTVRMMLPFSIQCSTCSTFLYRGRKFNSKKESVKGINGKYLGIQRYRFYIKCSSCSRPVTFLTDPKNADYEMESGGTRNYEVWHDESKTNAEFDKQVEEDEKLDSMKALENRVAESQREMAELDALEEIRAMNQRHVSLMRGSGKNKNTMDVAEAVLRAREAALGGGGSSDVGLGDGDELNENGLTKEEEDLVSSIQFGKQQGNSSIAVDDTSGSSCIRRLNEEDELLDEKYRMEEAESLIAKHQNAANERKARGESNGGNKTIIPVIKVKRKKIINAPTATVSESKRAKVDDNSPEVTADTKTDGDSGGGGALDGLLGYGSDSD